MIALEVPAGAEVDHGARDVQLVSELPGERQAGLEQRARGGVVADLAREGAEVVEEDRGPRAIAELALKGEALLEEVPRPPAVAPRAAGLSG